MTFERYLRADSSYMLHERHGNLGLLAQREAEEDAKAGSFMLADRCNRAIQKWAWQHRILPEQAMILLLDRRMP